MGTLWPQEHCKKLFVNGNIVFKFVKWVGNYVLIINHLRYVLGTIYISFIIHQSQYVLGTSNVVKTAIEVICNH